MIKTRIKEWIVKLPLMRGFMMKWIKARQDIEALQRQNLQQEKKINNMPELIHQGELCCDLQNIRMMRFEKNMAYYRMLEDKSALTKQELSLAEAEQELRSMRPLVSIIILNRNGRQHLEVLMTSFYKRNFYNHFEIICVDNASTDHSVAYLESWNKIFCISIIRNAENLSFSAANNLAAQSAQGDYLLFLNNDTEVTDGWLDELLTAFYKCKNPGAVGAKLVYPKIPGGTVNAGKSYCIQHQGIAFRHAMREQLPFIEPYNMRNGQADTVWETKPVECACVTAAVLLISKKAFCEVGGFDEKYRYGYEDVDLCLKLGMAGYKNYCCPSCLVYHYEFGTQSADNAKEVRQRRLHNVNIFKGKWQNYLSQKILEDKINGRNLFTEEKLTVAMAVTEEGPQATAGDYFTAMELANSLKKMGYQIKYLSRRGKADWYNVGMETDVLISFLDAYDIGSIHHAKNDLVKIAWTRNWFERWCEREYFNQFDIVLASSILACTYVDAHSRHKSILFPIASNSGSFFSKAEDVPAEEARKYHSDYVFTGSYWNAKRDIIDYLEPEALPYICRIFGANWENVERLKDYACGFVPYADMPKVYRNTKIVIDDANSATKSFGAVNSRVFDALASGVLVLTNGILGAEETFSGMLPSFDSKEQLREKLIYYLENDKEREELAAKLQAFVLKNHTYDVRAERLREILEENIQDEIDAQRIDICGTMPDDEERKYWGDYHFALAMKKEFEKMGYQVNVLSRGHWYDKSTAKYVIVLRGTIPYYPPVGNGRKYIMWNISHPTEVAMEEYNLYDYVFFASEKMQKDMGAKIRPDSSVLLQCADEEAMAYEEHGKKKYELLFVGNSRGIYRTILKDLLPTNYRLSVYGRGWDEFPVKDYVVSDHIENEKLGQAYHDAEIVLNDHWEDMKENGIISNRVFDVLAAGTFIISDDMPEIEELFQGSVITYADEEDLQKKVGYYLKNKREREELAKKGRRIVLKEHTFATRVRKIQEVIGEM